MCPGFEPRTDDPSRTDVGAELWAALWARVEQAEAELDRLRVLNRLLEVQIAQVRAGHRLHAVGDD